MATNSILKIGIKVQLRKYIPLIEKFLLTPNDFTSALSRLHLRNRNCVSFEDQRTIVFQFQTAFGGKKLS